MDRLQGVHGVLLILGIAWACSNKRRRINLRLVVSELSLQVLIAILIFHVSVVASFFKTLGDGMRKIDEFARTGATPFSPSQTGCPVYSPLR